MKRLVFFVAILTVVVSCSREPDPYADLPYDWAVGAFAMDWTDASATSLTFKISFRYPESRPTAMGICYKEGEGKYPDIYDNKVVAGGTVGIQTITLSRLQTETAYSCRAWVEVSGNVYYDDMFKIDGDDPCTSRSSGIPLVYWLSDPSDTTKITETTLKLCAQIADDGNYKLTECGFCFKTSDSGLPAVDANDNVIKMKPKGLGAFEMTAEGLTAGTTYYVRAWARNEAGIGYSSNVKAFKTSNPSNPSNPSDPSNPSNPPAADIKTVTGKEFKAASPSSDTLYRLTGGISYIGTDASGNISITTEDYEYIRIKNISSSHMGYGVTPDQTFPNYRLRRGDRVTLVGYRHEGDPDMNYAYLESSYRLQPSDFEGCWQFYCDMYESSDTTFATKGLHWDDVKVTYSSGRLEFEGLTPYASAGGSLVADETDGAWGVYDDETGVISVLGGVLWKNYWGYNEGYGRSVFYPVKVDTTAHDYSYYDEVAVNGYTGRGVMRIRASGWGGEYGFHLERDGKDSESRYFFGYYKYNPDTDEVGDPLSRSYIFQFYFMVKTADLTSSSSVGTSGVKRQHEKRLQIPQRPLPPRILP